MKIYKNTWSSNECYFVKSGTVKNKSKIARSCGYEIILLENGWNIRESEYYDKTLENMPFFCSSEESLETIIKKAILNEVLPVIEGTKMITEEDENHDN